MGHATTRREHPRGGRWLPSKQLDAGEHTAHPWRIHAITNGFQLEDVWAFSTPGAGPADFPVMLDALRSMGGLSHDRALVRLLFAVRWKLGALFGWDDPARGAKARVAPLADSLPNDLRQNATGTPVPDTPFTMLYELPDEAAIELVNKTVHTIAHLSWVQPGSTGDYELRLAALVQPNGLPGKAYLAAIAPFRRLIVYPALSRKWERAWENRQQSNTATQRNKELS